MQGFLFKKTNPMSKKKYYRSNLLGSYSLDGQLEIPPVPSFYITDDAEIQKILDNHSLNGHAYGFSEVPEPTPIKDLNADGTSKPTKFENLKAPKSEPDTETGDVDTDTDKSESFSVDDVTNTQLAKRYLLEYHSGSVDGRTLTTKQKVIEAATALDPPVTFPNWK